MSVISKIFSSGAKELVNSIGGLINGISTTDDEKSKLKKGISDMVLNHLTTVLEAQASVIRTEMSGNWLQRSWRPLAMLTFVLLLVAKWVGLTVEVDQAVELELMSIIKIGLGGFVAGRTIEKVADTVTKNIDMPFLKKKDRRTD